jgi:hypothetical protein
LTNGEIDEALLEAEDFEDLVEEVDREEVVEGGLLTGNVVVDLDADKGILTKIWEWMTSFTISGNVVLESELEGGVDIIETVNSTIIDIDEVVNVSEVNEVAVEFYTQAPAAFESNLSNGKRVVISAPSELNYTEILAYALIEDPIKMNDSRLRVYWYEEVEDNDTVTVKDKVEIAFVSYDFDSDGFVDYIEWVVPHLQPNI